MNKKRYSEKVQMKKTLFSISRALSFFISAISSADDSPPLRVSTHSSEFFYMVPCAGNLSRQAE